MRRLIVSLGILLLCTPVLVAQQQGKLVEDYWDAAYLEGQKTGYVHTTVHEFDFQGGKYLRTTIEQNLTLLRFKDVINLRMVTGAVETPGGEITNVFLRQFGNKGQDLNLTGTVEGDFLLIKDDRGAVNKKVAWDKDVLGLHRQYQLCQERKVKPGDRFGYQSYELSIQAAVQIHVAVKDEEEVDILGVKKKLLRVEETPDKIELAGNPIQLPAVVVWLDKDLLPAVMQLEMPGIGKLFLYRTTREAAIVAGTAEVKAIDLGLSTLIPLNKAIEDAQQTRNAVYRITIKGDDNPTTALAQDNRQEIKNARADNFELHVRSIREPQPPNGKVSVKEEYLKSCYYLNSADPAVIELTRRAIGRETDPWKRALLIEKWVRASVRTRNDVSFVPAGHIARDLQGDCRQHAVLAAAMCRAAGVPSRTAVGLVYVKDPERGPVMGFHMWTEVWINGQWIGIDPMLGQGGIGAAHIKIADHSWHDTETLAPLLSVVRVLGKLSIEVVSVNAE